MGIVKVQGSTRIHKFNTEAFKGDKALKKTDFKKKYQDRIPNLDGVWDKIQDALKAEKKAEAEAKKAKKDK